MRRARQVAVGAGDDAPSQPSVNTAAVAASLLQTSHAPDTSYQVVLEILKQYHESQDSMLVARLSGIRACLFHGMRVEYASETLPSSGDASQLARNCHLAVALVCTTQKAPCASTATGFLVSTAVSAAHYRLDNRGLHDRRKLVIGC